MATQLDDAVQKVILDWSGWASSLDGIHAATAKAFADILDSSMKGEFTALADLVGGPVAASFTKLTESVLHFVESSDATVVKLNAMAKAFGTTVEGIEAVKEGFAAVGLSSQMSERAIARMTQFIGNSWSEINKESRSAADNETAAHLKIQQSTIRVGEAYDRMQEHITKAIQAQKHDTLTAEGNAESLARAQQRLREAMSPGSVSEAEKTLLNQQEARLGVEKALQAIEDANIARAERMAHERAQELQDQLAIKEAVLAKSKAEEAAHQEDLKNIPKIAGQLNEIAAGHGKIRGEIDLTEVSAQHLAQAMVKATSINGDKPMPFDVFQKMSQTFKEMGNNAEAMGLKTEIVTKIMGQMGRQGGAAVSEVVQALSKGPEAFQKFQAALEHSPVKLSDKDIEAAKANAEAYAQLEGTLERVGNKLAAAFSPLITGTINNIVHAIEALTEWLGKAGGQGEVVRDEFMTLARAILDPWHFAVEQMVQFLTSLQNIGNYLSSTFQQILDNIKQRLMSLVPDWLLRLIGGGGSVGGGVATETGGGLWQGGLVRYDGGGAVKGPGTGTSDSIVARISNGEFIMRSAAVRAYGEGFMHMLNNMQLPGFAFGGLAPTPMRAAMAGAGPRSGSTLNLTIGNETFTGLHAPESVAGRLKSFSIGRQTAQTGPKPSWYR